MAVRALSGGRKMFMTKTHLYHFTHARPYLQQVECLRYIKGHVVSVDPTVSARIGRAMAGRLASQEEQDAYHFVNDRGCRHCCNAIVHMIKMQVTTYEWVPGFRAQLLVERYDVNQMDQGVMIHVVYKTGSDAYYLLKGEYRTYVPASGGLLKAQHYMDHQYYTQDVTTTCNARVFTAVTGLSHATLLSNLDKVTFCGAKYIEWISFDMDTLDDALDDALDDVLDVSDLLNAPSTPSTPLCGP